MEEEEEEDKSIIFDWTTVSGVTQTPYLDSADSVNVVSSPHRFIYGKGASRLYGREKEHSLLKETWERISGPSSSNDPSSSSPCSEVILVRGVSGTGKSFLIDSMRHHVEGANNGIFVSSKFDQISVARREPYYAVVSALSDLCEIVSADKESRRLIGDDIRSELGIEYGFFTKFVPTLNQLSVDDEHQNCQNKDKVAEDEEDRGIESFARTAKACEVFLSRISRHRPIFLVMEDIQWSDLDSASLVHDLISDNESKRICYVLSVREEDSSHRSVETVLESFWKKEESDSSRREEAELEESQHDSSTGSRDGMLRFTELKIGNLDEEHSRKLVCGLLNRSVEDNEEMHSMSKVVFEKTEGNSFFILQFMEMMRIKNVLTYSEDTDQWELDGLDKIVRLDVSDDVLKAVDARVYALDPTTRGALVIAAHIGFRFRVDLFEKVMVTLYKRTYRVEDEASLKRRFDRVLETAVTASMLIHVENKRELCFMHDRVQQCLYEMVAEGDTKSRTCLTIGRALLPMVEDRSLKFLITDLLNAGKDFIVNHDERMGLVKLNQEASEIALSRSSHSNSVHYLRIAIALIESPTVWSDHHKLSIELQSSLAWCLAHLGEFEDCYATVDNVLSHADDVLDKQRAHNARLLALRAQQKNVECVQAGLIAMKELGYRAMSAKPNMLSLMMMLGRLRLKLGRTPDSKVLQLPKVEDKRIAATLDLMEGISVSSLLAGPAYFMQTILHILDVTLKHGWSPVAPIGIGSCGFFEAMIFKNYTNAARYARLSQEMVATFECDKAESAVCLLCCFFLFPWFASWSDLIPTLFHGFDVGLKHGNMFFANANLGAAAPLLLMTKRLSVAAERCQYIVRMQTHLNASHQALFVLPYLQFALNLMGHSEGNLLLSGDAMQEQEFLASLGQDAIAEISFQMRKLELACYFRSKYQAQTYYKLLEKFDSSAQPICLLVVPKTFYCGLAYLSEAQWGDKRRRNIGKAKRALKQLEKISEQGCIDAVPFLCLLSAEFRATNGKKIACGQLQSEFDEAIKESTSRGFLGIAALANEHAYHALRTRNVDSTVTMLYWNRAVELYTDWEASEKVDRMKQDERRPEAAMLGRSCPPSAVPCP